MDLQHVLSGSLANIDKISPAPLLKNNQVIDAQVLQVHALSAIKTLVNVQIQGQALQLIVPQGLELTPGQSLKLQVISKEPVLTLKLLAVSQQTEQQKKPILSPASNKEIFLKQWLGEKIQPGLKTSPTISLKDLSRLSSPLVFHLTGLKSTEKNT